MSLLTYDNSFNNDNNFIRSSKFKRFLNNFTNVSEFDFFRTIKNLTNLQNTRELSFKTKQKNREIFSLLKSDN